MRLIDADKLDDTIIRLNEEDWQITRYEYKRIDGVVFEMPTVQAVPIDILDKIRAEIEQMNNLDYVEPVTVDEVLEIIDKYRESEG